MSFEKPHGAEEDPREGGDYGRDVLVNEKVLEYLKSNDDLDSFSGQYQETLSEDGHLVGEDGTVTERYPSDVVDDKGLVSVYESFAEASEMESSDHAGQKIETGGLSNAPKIESETTIEKLIDQERARLDKNLQGAALDMKSTKDKIKDLDGLFFNRPERFMIGIMEKLDEMRNFYNEPKKQEISTWDDKRSSPVDHEYWDNFYRSLGKKGTAIGIGVGSLSLVAGAPLAAAVLGGTAVRLGWRYFMHEGKKLARDVGALEQNTKLLDRVSSIVESSASDEDKQRFQKSLTNEEVEYLMHSPSISAKSRKFCGIE